MGNIVNRTRRFVKRNVINIRRFVETVVNTLLRFDVQFQGLRMWFMRDRNTLNIEL